jgi:predicted dehydrogenase
MRSSLATGAGFVLASPFSRVRGANEAVRVGVVGINGRGGSHISAFDGMEGTCVAGLCDVDKKVLKRRGKVFKDRNQHVDTYIDIRELLDNKDIDAISIATTNHWHSLATIWACQAGKDVYVEKPCSHNVFEGRQVRRSRREVQANRPARHGEPFEQ